MKTLQIDNSDAGYIERTILWQYDNAEHLKGIILSLKSFYDRSTKEHYDNLRGMLNLSDSNINDYGLAVWGKILNTNRPNLSYIHPTDGNGTYSLSSEVYRKILLGKIKLFEGSATLKEFAEYIKSIFGGGVTCNDELDMSLSFEKVEGSIDLTPELNALIEQAPDVVFVYPAGVRSSAHSTSNMFCLAEHNKGDVVGGETLLSATGQPTETEFNVGGLDESGFNWRLTAKGNWR